MLINCPRCGFQQPQDQYCAQCGVDMENYKPSTPPAWKRLLGNPLVQLSALVVVAGAVGAVLFHKGQQNFERRIGPQHSPLQLSTSANSGTPSATNSEATAANADAASTSLAENSAGAENRDINAADGTVTAYKVSPPTASAGAGVNAAAADDKAKDNKGSAKLNTPHLVVYYAEISRMSLAGIVAASRASGQFMEFPDYQAGLVPNISKALSAPQVQILHKEVRTLEGMKSFQWFYGIKDPRDLNIEIGLTTLFEINEFDVNNLRGNMEIQRSWREPLPSGGFEIQKKSFPAILELGGETGFFISDIMPRRTFLENDSDLTSIDVYKILGSPQFRSGNSTFVIFIVFENNNP